MNIAIVLAGGSGSRMQQQIPKQFININDKPIIIYTLEAFEKHPQIDGILTVCIDGWHEILKAYARQNNITKLKWVVNGGDTGQESIRNGVMALKDICTEDDLVIIHDGIRPLVDDSVLSDVIVTCEKYGNAVSALPYNEQIFVKTDNSTTKTYIPRETIMRVATPQAYRYGKLSWAYEKAFQEEIGIYGSAYTNTMMVDLGETLHFSLGSDMNIKLTTPEDLELFKAKIHCQNHQG